MAAAAAQEDFFATDPPHGKVKRLMWFKFLQSFIAKTQQSRNGRVDKTIICDVFAGPGVYEEHGWSTTFTDYGSPLIAVRAAIGFFIRKNKLPDNFEPIPDAILCESQTNEPQTLSLEDYKIELYFVEKDKQRYESLVENIRLFFLSHGIEVLPERKKSSLAFTQAIVSSIDESFPIRCIISNCEFVEFPPPKVPDNARMATFIDPFGFVMIPWAKVSAFVGEHKTLLINLMTSFMNRFFNKNRKKIGEVFGIDPDALEVFRYEDKEVEGDFVETLVDLYVEKLVLSGNLYLLTFEMRNRGNVRLYHLIYATNQFEGLKSMKESFNRGSQGKDEFSLSDYKILRKNIPLDLGNNQDPEQVARAIFDRFGGMVKVGIRRIEWFVWHDTPYVYRKKPLKIMEKDGRIVDVVGTDGEIRKRRFTFPDGINWLISFAPILLD